MPFFSFIMPVKNEALFIKDAINNIKIQSFKDWELIVVNDHSTDRTVEIVEEFLKKDKRIKLIHSKGTGPVRALNTGFFEVGGQFIKVIDGDDILDQTFSSYIDLLTSFEASYHDGIIISEKGTKISVLNNTSAFKNLSFKNIVKNLTTIITPPRWAWTVSKNVGKSILPLPDELPWPHDDLYFALLVKLNTNISYINKPLYKYRQHGGQLYGGIYNFSNGIVRKRASGMLGILGELEKLESLKTDKEYYDIFNYIKTYYRLMATEKLGMKEIMKTNLKIKEKAKVAVVKKCPWISSRISLFKSKLKNKRVRFPEEKNLC